MEITEDRIDELILEAQNWEEHDQLGAFAKEVIAIVERQREEIAALRETLEPFAAAGRVLNSKPSRGGALSDIVWSINDAAITVSDLQRADYLSSPVNAPAPEIKVGDRVRVTSGMHEGETGVVTVKGIHTVTIVVDGGKYYGHSISDVERIIQRQRNEINALIDKLDYEGLDGVDKDNAPAPEPAPEIKVGDSVRIIADNMYKGLIGRVTGVFPTYMVVETDSGNRRYFNLQEVEPIV